MKSSIRSTSALIDALGGTGALADAIGASPQNVSNWRSMDKFPAHTYFAMRTLIEKQGLSVSDSLWRMRGAA